MQKNHSNLRHLFWPIYGKEHRIYIPMALMVGLILFNYTILRNIKDSLVVTATGSSEIITFLKFCVVLPSSFLFFIIYNKMSNCLNKQKLFYYTLIPFLIYFATFAFILYPLRDTIHPDDSALWLQQILPKGAKGLVDCYRFWSYSLFYTMAELWGAVVSALLFWQFANDVIPVINAKRFYSHFYLLANVFTASSGIIVKKLSVTGEAMSSDVAWGLTIQNLTYVILFAGMIIAGIYAYLNRYVFTPSYHMKNLGENLRKRKSQYVLEGSLTILDAITLPWPDCNFSHCLWSFN